jgi:hypothetical protein
MAQETVCIYCGKSKSYCEAHIVPESLGKFKNQPKQKELVCSECDHEIGKAEEQLIKCGSEAIFRVHLNIKGKKKHKPSSPFRRKHTGQGPIELKTTFPGRNYEVLVEPLEDGQNVQPLPQLVLLNPDGEHACIRLPNPIEVTPEYLKNALRQSSLKGKLRVETVGMTNEEIDHVFGLFRNMGIFINEEDAEANRKSLGTQFYPNVLVRGSVKVDSRYFRAIAKIGFHYFLQYSEYFSGHENFFTLVKDFIRYGKGEIEHFVSQHHGNLVSDLNYGFRPKYYGHFIVGDFHNNMATAYVQLFIGRDSNPPYYKIALAKNCLHIKLEDAAFGHFYTYYPPENRSQYTGEMQQLGVANRIRMPKNFRVDYLDG